MSATRWIRIVGWETRAKWRQLLPNRIARVSLFWLALVFWLFMTTGILMGRDYVVAHPPPTFAGPLLFLLLLTTNATVRIAAIRIADARRIRAKDAAPLSATATALTDMAPAVLTAALPFFYFALPFGIAMATSLPAKTALLTINALCASLWALAIGFGATIGMVRLWGVETGTQRARSFGSTVAALVFLAPGIRFDVEAAGYAMAILPAATAVVVPPLLWWLSTIYRELHASPPPTRRSPSPRWGHPDWHARLLRTRFLPSTVAHALVIPWALTTSMPFALVAFLSVSWVSLAVSLLLADDYATPDRLRLAPCGQRLRANLLLTVGLPCLLAACAVVVAVGWHHPIWIALVCGLLCIQLATTFAPSRGLRLTISVALSMTALMSQLAA